MNTLELLSSLEGCKIVKREDGVIEIIPEVESKEAPKFKDGDFVVFTDHNGDEFILIYKNSEDDYIRAYCHVLNGILSIHSKGERHFYKGDIDSMRIANNEERLEFLEALHNERKIWNQETKTIEEDRAPRFGDKCVFWDDEDVERECVFVSKYCGHIKGDKYKHRSENYMYQHCVRIQDYDFEKMQPKTI